ncbi:hypothetical protein AOQ84DRAFT_70790 [Glonium stellatum]|uniref:Uncharacterized protein n=1 Tax=Glonium stellatum TaxID=574774 RepID=A0A8E2EXK3_9PEZI|nr:hypothetical protein AOQ84DRAFT_70790 [Glonium stellatum]
MPGVHTDISYTLKTSNRDSQMMQISLLVNGITDISPDIYSDPDNAGLFVSVCEYPGCQVPDEPCPSSLPRLLHFLHLLCRSFLFTAIQTYPISDQSAYRSNQTRVWLKQVCSYFEELDERNETITTKSNQRTRIGLKSYSTFPSIDSGYPVQAGYN